MKDWKTTVIGVIALLGLAYNGYVNGGFSVSDFMLLITGIGFLVAKDSKDSNSVKVSGIRKDDHTDIGGDNPPPSDGGE